MPEISRRLLSPANGDHLCRARHGVVAGERSEPGGPETVAGACAGSEPRIVKTPSEIRHAQAGDVVLLKGVYFNSGSGSGAARAAVHRSPPIERQGATRVVLVATAYRSDS